jgi:hypothetical protein
MEYHVGLGWGSRVIDALIIAPNHAWAEARAKDLNFNRHQWKYLDIMGAMEVLQGIRPNEDGPTVFIGGPVEIIERIGFTYFSLLEYLSSRGFEIFELDKMEELQRKYRRGS